MNEKHKASTERIEVIAETMFAGKTGELFRRVERSEIAEQDVQVFKPEIDDRYSKDTICSHRGTEWETIKIESGNEEEIKNLVEADVVAIDEANFFGSSLVDACQELADTGTRVIVSGLDQNFRGEPFTPMRKMLAVADYVDKFHTICEKCGEPATKPQRLIDGEPAHEDEPTVVVDAEEKYEARCRNVAR